MARQPLTAGPYTLLRILGAGGLGPVHLGRTDKGARVAVRLFRPALAVEPGFRTRLREEVEAAARVPGPLVVPVLDADTDADVPWVATEFVPAPSLAQLTDARGPLSVDGVRRVGIALAEALHAIHEAGTAHRGLTPGTVLIAPDGARVVDVGIAGAVTGDPFGTPGYLAPEQLDGTAEPASDLFALGGVLLHAATWREPFGLGHRATVLHRTRHDAPDLGGVDPGMAPVLATCLDRDPERRPRPLQVRDALAAALSAG